MSVQRFTTAATQLALQALAQTTVQQLQSVVPNYPNRTLFATQFSLEDQVLSHLIFGHDLPVRVFTLTGGDQHCILVDSVEFFNANIEVSFRQTRRITIAFAQQHPDVAATNADTPATAPLTQVLQGHHLLISSLRKDQLSRRQPHAAPVEWDEANQRAIFYPLFDWTEQQVREYVAQHRIPHLPLNSPLVTDEQPQPAAAPNPKSRSKAKRRDSKTTPPPAFLSATGLPVATPSARRFWGLLE